MSRIENENRPPVPAAPALETEVLQAWEGPASGLARLKRRVAHEMIVGQPAQAFSEVVRATRDGVLTPALASLLARTGRTSGSGSAALALLKDGQGQVEGRTLAALHRIRARLLRRTGNLDGAGNELRQILREMPSDRRSLRLLQAVSFEQKRWTELQTILEREAMLELSAGRLRRAVRWATLETWVALSSNEARPASSSLSLLAEAAWQNGEWQAAFFREVLSYTATLCRCTDSAAVLSAETLLLLRAERVNRTARARSLVQAARLSMGTGSPGAALQRDLIAAADEAAAAECPTEMEGLLYLGSCGPDAIALSRLETRLVARRAWRLLVDLYRFRAGRESDVDRRIEWLGRLAELLEEELGDHPRAAEAYGEIVRLSGDVRALDQQVRILESDEEVSSVGRALDGAVARAPDASTRADAKVARGRVFLRRNALDKARADFQAALQGRSAPPGRLARTCRGLRPSWRPDWPRGASRGVRATAARRSRTA